MRILHTSDWHLGRLFHELHLTDDQAYVLEQVVARARETRPDVLVIAGDIYDRAVPPPQAVSLLNDVLSRLVLELGVRVIMTSGNHDSPERLNFGATIMENRGLHIVSRLSDEALPVIVEDRYGPVAFYALPYAEPAEVRECLGMDTITDHHSAMSALVSRIRQRRPQGVRTVLVTHAFVAGGRGSESERPLSVGGTGTVEAKCFGGFDYVALGHLHRPQQVGDERIHYSGSLLKYSFSEIDHDKCLKLVEMDDKGRCSLEAIPLVPRHDVKAISGYLDELVRKAPDGVARSDYLAVTLLDTGALFNPMGKLREAYPNVLWIAPRTAKPAGERPAPAIDHRKTTETEQFAGFYREVTGEAMSADQRKVFRRIVERLRQEDREAHA